MFHYNACELNGVLSEDTVNALNDVPEPNDADVCEKHDLGDNQREDVRIWTNDVMRYIGGLLQYAQLLQNIPKSEVAKRVSHSKWNRKPGENVLT